MHPRWEVWDAYQRSSNRQQEALIKMQICVQLYIQYE